VPFDEARVLKCFRHLKGAGNLLAVSVSLPDDSKRIATGLFMCDGRELHLWGWAHRTAYGSYCPVELLTWTAMRRAMEAGCTTLDMGGGGDAKRKYGALPDATMHEWMWSRYAWLARARDFAERVYRRQQSVRGRLARKRAGVEGATAHAAADAAAHTTTHTTTGTTAHATDPLARTTGAIYADELAARES
jgi:Acetyltransferase (GNAT) domain